MSDINVNKSFTEDNVAFNENEIPYLQYIFASQNQGGMYQDEPKLVKMNEIKRKNFVFIDDFRGNKVMVKTHTPNQLSLNQEIRLMFYQCSGKQAVFIFAVFN